ncbi:hypothetical protein EG327_011489 [Venturia inaequalis]|uniref:Uncharacterized protein n=1 Tax=Venturia inaequalis TaxID=5025 RepID=A0A8H3UCI7_VENIN|nr:hypothetical protein EG327_011489 [Venturia inaequalis]
MLHPDGIEVYIKSLDRDQPYAEYVKPGNSEAASSKWRKRYIEIQTGERFSIIVNINKGFDCHGEQWVGSFVHLGDRTFCDADCENTETLEKKNVTVEIDEDEDLYYQDFALSSFKESLGIIAVSICFGRLVPLLKPSSLAEFSGSTSSTSKKLHKNLGITNSVRPVLENAKEVPQPSIDTRFRSKYKKFNYHFAFFYRPSMTLERLGIKPRSPVAQPIVMDLNSDAPADLNFESNGDSPVVTDIESDVSEELNLDLGSDHGQIDTAADVQAKFDGRKRIEAIEKTLRVEASQRTKFFLESYKDKYIEFSGTDLELQLTPDSQNNMFSLSSAINSELSSAGIDSRRFRHIQWSPYECSLVRLNGVQNDSKASLTRDLKFITRQEAEFERMIRLFMNFPVERMPVCGGPEPSKLLSPRQVVPVLTENIQSPLPTPTASPPRNGDVASPLVFGTNAAVSSNISQSTKRKTLEDTVTDEEERGGSETPETMSKKARVEPDTANDGTLISPPSSESSATPMFNQEELAVAQSNCAATSVATPTPFLEPLAAPIAETEAPAPAQPNVLEVQTTRARQDDVIDLTADDDDVSVKTEPSETRAVLKQDRGKGSAETSGFRLGTEFDEEQSKDDILDAIKLLDIERPLVLHPTSHSHDRIQPTLIAACFLEKRKQKILAMPHSRATKRARIDYAIPETDGYEIEEEEDLYIPNRTRRRQQQPRSQKVICDDTDDDEDGNVEAIARMRRQMEAEAVQHHDEAGPLEQATNVPSNPRLRLQVPAIKIEAIDLTGIESTMSVKIETRSARRARATAPTMTSSDLKKQLHLLELKTREAKFERQRFELKLQLDKVEREDN